MPDVLTPIEASTEAHKAASAWAPKFLAKLGAWIAQREHYGPGGMLTGLETFGAWGGKGANRRFSPAYFFGEDKAADICGILNDKGKPNG